MAYTLVIANQRYSSWSLRPWLLMKTEGIPFDEKKIFLKKPDTAEKIAQYSKAGKVPILIDGKIKVWESLAICEYLAEKYPEKNLWPKDEAARAFARSVSHEMHASFTALRSQCSMNCGISLTNFKISPDTADDVRRITEIWREAREQYGQGGEFLFGQFSVADAMYAPVVIRFKGYGVQVDDNAQKYMKSMLALPAMQAWIKAGLAETEKIPAYEPA